MITKFKTALTALFVVIGTATASAVTVTDPNDFTSLINNPAYLHKSETTGKADYAGWTLSPELPANKWRDYEVMNLITYSGNVNFTIQQTIASVPAGIYRLSVYGFYRPGSVADEAERVANGEPVHNLALFATIGDKTFTENILNLYEGAQPEDIIGKDFHPQVAGYESFYCPDGASDSRAFYLQGCYRNDLVITVPEDGPVTIGVTHPDGRTYDSDYAPIGGWELYKIGEVKASEDLECERETGQGYNTNTYSVDFSKALEFLGIDDVNNATLYVVNPDGTEIKEYSAYDGWFDGDGVATVWGTTTKINVKFFQAIPNGKYNVCDMNGADVVGASYTVKWALKANSRTYTYNITVKFIKPAAVPEVTTVGNLYQLSAVEYDYAEASYVEKTSTMDEEQVAAICKELGITSLGDAYVYGYNPTTQTFIPIKELAKYDGWRKADGDFASWTGNSTVPMCVKYSDGTTYFCYNITGCDNAEMASYWAFGNTAGYAVLVKIPFIYSGAPQPTAITFSDLNVLATQEASFSFELGTSYQGASANIDIDEILATLGATSLDDVTIYAVLPDGTLDANYKLGTTDGWRDAKGNWQSWGSDAYFYVKTNFELPAGQITDVGTYAGSPQTEVSAVYTANFVFVLNNATHDAVQLSVVITYGSPSTAINQLTDATTAPSTLFDLSGRKVISGQLPKGINIINGQKVYVK